MTVAPTCRPLSVLLALLLFFAQSACSDEGAPVVGPVDAGGGDDSSVFDTELADAASDAADDTGGDLGTLADAPGADPCPGAAGCACQENVDCVSTFCIETTDGSRCAGTCVDTCPDGFKCSPVAGPGGDVVVICVPRYGRLCDPCAASKDCQSLGLEEPACVDQGGAGSFCGVACAANGDCPEGYGCQNVASVEKTQSKQCVRTPAKGETTGQCPCSKAAVAQKLATACYHTVKDAAGEVVGKCQGKRTCLASGLSGCAAPPTSAEVCDGQDNDCNGKIDDLACDDGNPCTEDTCDPGKAKPGDDGKTGGCAHNKLSAVGCDADGSVCTVADLCQDGLCKAGKELACDDGNPCTKDSCDLAAGCTQVAFDGLPCDADASACTIGDTCQNAACVAGVKVACDDASPCTTDGCDAKTGKCAYQPLLGEIACDDASPCTKSDTCTDGSCVGKKLDCDDGDPCTADGCDPVKGCTYTQSTAPCTDDNPCTVGDKCKAGKCIAGAVKQCQSSNACVLAACDPTQGGKCNFKNKSDGAACDDDDACTSKDGCKGGICVGIKIDCQDKNQCTLDSCSPKTGCTFVASTAPCSDGNGCTIGDICKSKQCVPGAAKICVDAALCTADSCDLKTGDCLFAALPMEGTPCSADDSVCTVKDACKGGKCVAGKALACDDGNSCSADNCHATQGCKHTAISLPCDADGSVCTVGDVCKDQTCVAGSKKTCDDGDGCTSDACHPKSGCVFTANQVACDDGNPCTKGDVCGAKKCQPGTNICSCEANADCAAKEDGNLCNGTLFCDKSKLPYTCQVNPKTMVSCAKDQDSACLANQCAAKTGQCKLTPIHQGQSCDADGSVCTVKDSCDAGKCVPGGLQKCDDGNPCTADSCDKKTGCTAAANAASCDADGNPCTLADTCKNKVCLAGKTKVCDDGNHCTADACNTNSGKCVASGAAVDGKGCDADGSICTVGDSCKSGKCTAGAAKKCADGNPCTDDSCDGKTGKCTAAKVKDQTPCGAAKVCKSGVCKDKGSKYFGDGSDGKLQVKASQLDVNAYSYLPGAKVDAGATKLTLKDAKHFAVGDEIMIHQTQHAANAGQFEFGRVVAKAGQTLTLASALGATYESGKFNVVGAVVTQVVRVPQFTDVVVSAGANIVARQWDGIVGGVIVFRASGEVTISGGVVATGAGFRTGGQSSCGKHGQQGEGYRGKGILSTNSNFGGGGGSTSAGFCGDSGAGGSGGGGYGTVGGNGVPCGSGCGSTSGGKGGLTYGASNLSKLLHGGGSGSDGRDNNCGQYGSKKCVACGSDGGGIIRIVAATIVITGKVMADGENNSTSSGQDSVGPASGAGGSVHLSAKSISMGSSKVTAVAGAPGKTHWCKGGPVKGGMGRIRVDGDTVVGTTWPTAVLFKLFPPPGFVLP